MNAIEARLGVITRSLAWLQPPPVFIGGATIGLYLDAFGRSQLRPTLDVDCIVPALLASRDWWTLEADLRHRGWRPVPDGPLCRYRSPDGFIVDLLAADPAVQGFAGRWFGEVVAQAIAWPLPDGTDLLIAPPALLLACKLDAFESRGRDDPWSSRDLEDIVALIDGCAALADAVAASDAPLRDWLAERLRRLLGEETLLEVALAQLPRGGDEAARERRFVLTLEAMVAASNQKDQT